MPTNERWLRSCSLGERDLLDRVLGPTLSRWGYGTFRGVEVAPR